MFRYRNRLTIVWTQNQHKLELGIKRIMKVISEILSFIFELYKSIIGNVARSEEDKIEMDKEKKRVIDSYRV